MGKEKIRNLDEIIKEIENCDYIDCHKDEIFDDYQYENILYYLKQLKKQKEIIEKVKDILILKKARCLNEDDYILNVTDLDDIRAILEDKEDNDKK